MTFRQAQEYLDSFIDYERIDSYSYEASFNLERIKSLLQILDNPQDAVRFLHIAGTKGKGSSCVFLASILSQAGFRIGLYTSPHLADFRERIRILNRGSRGDFVGRISRQEICKCVLRLKPAIEKFNRICAHGSLSFFEVYTTLAFLYFREKKVDLAVLETGLGGRLDATNAASSLVAGITPLSYEHTQKLGNSLAQIAAEKAGIIKNKGQIVVCAPQLQEAKKIIEARCKKLHARLFRLGKDIAYQSLKATRRYQVFKVRSLLCNHPQLKSRLLGNHQIINASLAVGMAEALSLQGIKIPPAAIRRGIALARWPGRFEVIAGKPGVILDGAQNVASCQALKATFKEIFGKRKVILVLGISRDKDLKGICRQLEPIAKEIILTRSQNPRASQVEILRGCFSGRNKITVISNVTQAMEAARLRAKGGDLILVTGSLFVVAEAREICRRRS